MRARCSAPTPSVPATASTQDAHHRADRPGIVGVGQITPVPVLRPDPRVKWTNRTPRHLPGVRKMVTLLIALGFFILIAILGPLLGADSRVPGGWTPIEPGGKLWPGPR